MTWVDSKVLKPEALQGLRCSQPKPAQIATLTLPFCRGRLDELFEISQLLISSIDFSKTQIYVFFFSCCWIEDAENGSWFTSDQMDLAEWFNSSHAAGCRKILSHFTERMFLLSFLVITYLHELAQLGGSGGSCVAPSVCISYHWFWGQIIKTRKEFFVCICKEPGATVTLTQTVNWLLG